MRFRTSLFTLVCVAAITAAGTGVASAGKPDITKPYPDEFVAVLPPEVSCGDLGVTVSSVQGKSHSIYFADGRTFYHAPGAKYRVAAGDASVVVQGSGAFHDEPAQLLEPPLEYDGVTYELAIPTKLTGHNLLAGVFIDANSDTAPAVLAVRGRATVTLLIDFEGDYVAFADFRGSATDLCAVLRG